MGSVRSSTTTLGKFALPEAQYPLLLAADVSVFASRLSAIVIIEKPIIVRASLCNSFLRSSLCNSFLYIHRCFDEAVCVAAVGPK